MPVLAIVLMGSASASGHGPFDNSSQLIVTENRMEVSVALGLNAAKQVLARAGAFPKLAVAEAAPGVFPASSTSAIPSADDVRRSADAETPSRPKTWVRAVLLVLVALVVALIIRKKSAMPPQPPTQS